MPCTHRHIVIHRNDVEDHRIPEDGPETSCSCQPGLICPVCDWGKLYHDCFVVAPPDLVDALSVHPDPREMN